MNFYKKKIKRAIPVSLLSLLFTFGCVTTVSAKRKETLGVSGRHAKLLLAQYEQAKQLYQAGRYLEAKSLLEPLRSRQPTTSLSPYIHFYYALAAYHNGEKELAAQTFLEIRLQFPLWNKQNEIHYWSAQCAFQAGHFEEALALLAVIQDPAMAKPVVRMKKYFLKQIEDDGCLQGLIEKFPNDPLIKELLHKKVARQAYSTQDFSLLNRLKQQYNFSNDLYDPLKCLQSKQKKAYRVAVLLPLFVEELDYEACTDQFVIELYQGIQLAVEALAQEGIVINLFAFDTKKDAAVTKALLAQKALPYMDLIIGPLYPDTIPLVAAFAKKHKINFVNPMSSNAAITHGNPFVFLFQPSLETYAQRAAQLTLSDISTKSVEESSIAVFYSTEGEDVLQATLYKRIVEQQLGRKLDLFVQLSNETIKDFFDKASKQAEEQVGEERKVVLPEKEEKQLDLTKLTHIYVPSHHKLLVSSVISLSLKLGIRPQIIGHEEWIKKEILNMNQLCRLPLLFLAPKYIDFSRPALRAFREKFFQKTATQPNEQSYIGYEMMLFFGRMLGRYGTYFQKEWENIHYNGIIFQGLCYGKHHSNQHIPVVRFAKDQFVVEATPLINDLKNQFSE